MCGRYALDPSTSKPIPAVEQQRLPARWLRYAVDYNLTGFDIRPTTLCAVELPQGRLGAGRWGWRRDFATGGRIINARWETATEKRTFAEAVERRRCVIPATAYYEWQRDERDRPVKGGKHAFRQVGGGLFAMAGLWEEVAVAEGATEVSFLVLTRTMVQYAVIHDRTPVMLSDEAVEAWLDPAAPMGDVLDAARSMGDDDLAPYRVADGPTKARAAGAWLLGAVPPPGRVSWQPPE